MLVVVVVVSPLSMLEIYTADVRNIHLFRGSLSSDSTLLED